MKLRDPFLFREPKPAAHPLGSAKQALAGIGDREVRAAQDFLWSMGVAPVAGAAGLAQWHPMEGDEVEFVLPGGDGVRRAGRIHQVQGRDAIVQVNAGEYNIVPLDKLAPRSKAARRAEQRAVIQAAMSPRGPKLNETRALIPLGENSYACTVEHIAGLRPSSEDIEAYVASKYPGARVVDGDDTHPGKLGLVLSFQHPEQGRRALEASRLAQTSGPAEPPSSRENATGIGTEEIDGTGKIADSNESAVDPMASGGGDDLAPMGGDDEASIITTEKRSSWLDASAKALNALGERYAGFDVTETSIEETSQGFVSHFALTKEGRRVFVREGELTTVLAEGVAPAIGTVAVSDAGVTIHLARAVVADYDAGQGPMSMHENELGANDTGSYVVKADGLMPAHGDFEQEGKPLSQRDMAPRPDDMARYQLQQTEQAQAEQLAKQRRLMRQKELQQQSSPGMAPMTPIAAEEDGEHRETIGGPGLHIAVDENAEEYWENYFGPYGDQLTKDVATRVGEMVRSAWKNAGREEPTAEELLWATGVLLAPLEWDASKRVADQADDVAKALMQSARVSGPAKQKLQQLVSGYMAKMDPRMRQRYKPNDPKVWQSVLPTILRAMPPKQLNNLTYQFAPDQASDKPGLLSRMWNRPGRDRGRIERGLEMDNLMNPQPAAPAAGGAAPPTPTPGAPAPTGAPPAAGAPAGAPPAGAPSPTPFAGPAPGGGGGGGRRRRRGPGQGAPMGGGQRVTIPAGTTVIGPDGKPFKLPSAIPASMGAVPAGTPTPSAPGPAATPPATPALPAPPAPPSAPTPPAGAPTPPAGGPKPPWDPLNPPSPAGASAPRSAGWTELPKGARAWNAQGKQVTIRQPTAARIVSSEGGVTFVRTQDGQVLALEGPTTLAQASLHTADAATDAFAGRRPPAKNQLRFRMEELSRRGDYLVASVVWDADAAKTMSPADVVANIKSFVKQRAGEKEFIDLGFIGKPLVDSIDLEMGIAEVRFRSSNPGAGPTEIIEREDAAYNELV